MKRCGKCGQEKARTEFGKDRSRGDGLNPRCRDCHREQGQNWRDDNREKYRESSRRAAQKWRFKQIGVEVEEYQRLFKKQRGRCAICCQKPKKALCLDHCHDTGKVRGLLCIACNVGIGNLGHDPKRLQAALRYLAG